MIKLVVKAEVPEGGTKEFSYEFDQPVVTMGRLKENDIQLPLSTVSGLHAQILKEEDSYYLLDRGSINGTYLNGSKLNPGEKKLLNDGDILKVQTFELYFSTGITAMNIDAGATVQVARQMVMEVLGSWQTNVAEKPRLIVMGGPYNGKKVDLVENKPVVVGRVAECDIMIDHPSVSRKHTEISITWSGAFIKDLKSANGVFVNDQRVVGSQKLRDRDEIRLGQQTSKAPVILVFSNPAEALLSQIEDIQSTDSSKPVVVESPAVADAPDAPPAAASPAPTPEATPEAAPVGGVPAVVEDDGAPSAEELAAEEAEEEFEEKPKKSALLTIGALIAALITLGAAAFSFYYMYTGMGKSSDFSVDPVRGGSGDVVRLIAAQLEPTTVKEVRILDQKAKIVEALPGSVRVELPEFPGLESLETRTEIVVDGKKGELAKIPFIVVLVPRIKTITPRTGTIGSEIRVQTNMPGAQPTVLFGTNPGVIKSRANTELVVVVPRPTDLVPVGGLKVPISLRVNDRTSSNQVDFVVLPEPVVAEETFRLSFEAKPYKSSLGFNEHSVETNIGPLLLMVSKGTLGSSQERAQEGARNLNQAMEYFKANPGARVILLEEGDHFTLFGDGAAGGARAPLVSIYQEDTLGYAKITGHAVELEQLSNWWQMLLDAYFRVFVQVETPPESGIGGVFKQIFNFYAVGNEQGKKYYKKDFLATLPADQRDKLLATSFALPQKVLNVEGKWAGAVSNILYKNLSVEHLEMILTLRQSGSAISGTAEMNWKVILGGGSSNFQNVAYRKLGTYNVKGTYHKDKGFPLEMSFTEKEGRRLDFIGKVEGDILFGKFIVSSTNEDGTWNLKLQK